MISAVCGRAPPPKWLPWASLVPPLLPVICQDWLSVMKTRAFCASEADVCAAAGISNSDRAANLITDGIRPPKHGLGEKRLFLHRWAGRHSYGRRCPKRRI